MTTIFGNPGSTELPMLADFPDDFRYVLGLQEAVVVGMADGYAQASGRPAHVNLHTAPGVGNAMGAIFNAQANKSPLLVTAGQQARVADDAAGEPHQPRRDADAAPARQVELRAAARRGRAARARPRRSTSPRCRRKGPVFVSIPMDDWDAEVDDDAVAHHDRRARSTGRAGADPEAVRALAERLDGGEQPGARRRPRRRRQRRLGRRRRARRARSGCRSGPRPRRAAAGIGFPEGHPHFQGVLPPAIGPLSETLEGHDLILVAGSSVFPYYPNIPGPLLPEGAALVAITSDPDEAARAPMGDAIVADVALTLEALLAEVGESDRAGAASRARRPSRREESDPMSAGGDRAPLGRGLPRRRRSSCSSRRRARSRCATSCASRGPAATTSAPAAASASASRPRIGVQLAQPDRPVVCVLGEGSAQYAISGFWTAVAYEVPVTFLVLRNEEYAILKWFAEIEQVTGAPGLDLPALDVAAVAAGYGVASVRAGDRDELREALGDGIAASGPRLVEVARRARDGVLAKSCDAVPMLHRRRR